MAYIKRVPSSCDPQATTSSASKSHVTHARTHTGRQAGREGSQGCLRVAKSRTHPERHMSRGVRWGGLGYLPALLLTFAAKVDIINLQRVASNGMCVHALPSLPNTGE